MNTRQSPYPDLGPDGHVVSQPQTSYAPPPPPQQHYQQQQQPQQQPQYHMNPSPQYAQPQQPTYNGGQSGMMAHPAPPAPQGSQGYGNGNGKTNWAQQQYTQDYGDKTQKFDNVKPKWNDIFFAIFFVAQFLGFIAIAVIVIRSIGPSSGQLGQSGGTSITLDASTAYLLSFIAGCGFVFSIGLLLLVRAFTTVILEITLLLSVLLSIAYAVYLWIEKYWSGAIIFTLFAVISVIAYFPMRRRIPLSKQLLLFVLKIAKKHPSVYVIALIGCSIQAVYSVFFSFVVVGTYQKFHVDAAGSGTSGGSASNATLIGLIVYEMFSFYYVSQFIINYFLTIEAGIFGSVYFGGFEAKSVTWGAFKRASTYSMGSIAFGSLIVAVLDLIRAGLSLLRQYEAGQGDAIGQGIACCAECCIGCIASLVEYFNRYAMIEIALYGKPYIQASKDAWNLFKDRGIDALVNDSLVNNIWTFGSYAVGAICSAFAFIYLTVVNPSYVADQPSIRAAVMLYAFAIGFFICHTLGYGALSSGVSTIFVGLGEDPDALAERDPALFEMIRRAYPKVVTSV